MNPAAMAYILRLPNTCLCPPQAKAYASQEGQPAGQESYEGAQVGRVAIARVLHFVVAAHSSFTSCMFAGIMAMYRWLHLSAASHIVPPLQNVLAYLCSFCWRHLSFLQTGGSGARPTGGSGSTGVSSGQVAKEVRRFCD